MGVNDFVNNFINLSSKTIIDNNICVEEKQKTILLACLAYSDYYDLSRYLPADADTNYYIIKFWNQFLKSGKVNNEGSDAIKSSNSDAIKSSNLK